MKKLLISLVFATLVAGCGSDMPTDTEVLDSGSALLSSNGAVVWRGDIGCSVIDGTGAWFPEDWSLPCGTEIATYGTNLNAKVTVQATGVPNPSGKAVHWGPYNPGWGAIAAYPQLSGPPYPCLVLGTDHDVANPLWTVNWKADITPSGNGTLVCHYMKKWEFHCEDFDNCAGDPWP